MKTIVKINQVSFVGGNMGYLCWVVQHQKDGITAFYANYNTAIKNVVFFGFNEAKECEVLANFEVLNLKDNNRFQFELDIPKLNKIPVHLQLKSVKPKEKFFLIDSTLYICGKEVGLSGPFFRKDDRTNPFDTMHFDSVNFVLTETWKWNSINGPTEATNRLMDDYVDYVSTRRFAYDKLRENYSFTSMEDIDELINILQSTKTILLERMEWWKTATIEELLQLYKEKEKKRGEN